jgi:small-conductance mechanosensitive channel
MFPLQIGIGGALTPLVVNAVLTATVFVLVFAVLYLFGKPLATRVTRAALERRGFDETLIGLAGSLVGALVLVFSIALAATVAGFGVVLAAFATLAGALALAVGFAARDLIANFVAGIFIIQDEPFAVGDWIEWDGNGGVVREIQLRVTKLDTFDNELVTVPNSELAGNAVYNNGANDTRRITMDVGIGYDDDISAAREAILEEATAIDAVLDDPEPAAPVSNLGDSAVVLSARFWIDPDRSSYGATRATFAEAIKERLDREGIDMPYPTSELTGGLEVTTVEAHPSD